MGYIVKLSDLPDKLDSIEPILDKIVEGDCLDLVTRIPNGYIDVIVTDPPYGIKQSSNHGASWSGKQIDNDEDTSARDKIVNRFTIPIPTPMAIFGSWKRKPPDNTRATLIWDKGPAFGMGDLSFPWKPSFDEIYILGSGWAGKRGEGVLRGHLVVSWESKGRCHQNQKPVSLILQILNKLTVAKIIFDPFLGSGTTAVAAKKLGRHFIGCEINPEYCKIAERRLLELDAQPGLFR